ncbi:type IV toxin-antitoxin system AbiEi family antitoxin domain-containing protein [Streptomyces sp. NPDC047028]|uniref:type IV toxin-antitoxin system AbiEi family antitoxin domain-containing protein n=1 Tax=Streptomyces sp. NPDC047028 TaxID=3155793 RepID=UPI0033F67524
MHAIRARLPELAPSPGTAAIPSPRRRPAAAPSIRAAVEQAVAAFPGPFSARDVLRVLPAGVYGDPSKTISNVLSTLVKSGRLQRVSRGTYAGVPDPAEPGDAGHGGPKSA